MIEVVPPGDEGVLNESAESFHYSNWSDREKPGQAAVMEEEKGEFPDLESASMFDAESDFAVAQSAPRLGRNGKKKKKKKKKNLRGLALPEVPSLNLEMVSLPTEQAIGFDLANDQ